MSSLHNTIQSADYISLQAARSVALPVSNINEPILKASEVKPHDLAVALGLLEGDHYKALQPSDYLLFLSKGQSDRVQLYDKTNEKIKLWVIRSILHYDTVSDRSDVMKFYINTAIVSPKKNFFRIGYAVSQSALGMLFDAELLINRCNFQRPCFRFS
jgi:son of sevenless-like protein